MQKVKVRVNSAAKAKASLAARVSSEVRVCPAAVALVPSTAEMATPTSNRTGETPTRTRILTVTQFRIPSTEETKMGSSRAAGGARAATATVAIMAAAITETATEIAEGTIFTADFDQAKTPRYEAQNPIPSPESEIG